MEALRPTIPTWLRNDEQGFTLFEVLATITVMGILAAITIASWQGVVDGRRVDSAANQLASDFRLAQSKASNRLAAHVVAKDLFGGLVSPDGEPHDYYLVEIDADSLLSSTVTPRDLPDGADVTAFGVRFESEGDARAVGGGALASPATVTVFKEGGNPAASPRRVLEVAPATSRVKLDP